jgi:Ca2+-binding RTX toxin-like protein
VFSEGWKADAVVYYAAGAGNLTLQIDSGLGTVNLDAGIARSDVSLASGGATITDGVGGDLITILKNGAGGFNYLEFADGTTIDLHKTGGTHLATANSTLTGTGLDDIYSYNAGTGHVTLSDTGGANALWLGAGITAANLIFQTSGNDVLIYDGVNGDVITDVNRKVQTILFADGTTMSALAAGNNYTLASGTTVTGSGFNDTYSYARGTGTATLADAGGVDTISLGTSILAANLTFTSSGTDLLITDGYGTDRIVVQGQTGSDLTVETLKFADGSSMALSGLALQEASGQTSMNGTAGDDTLFGNSGSQTLNGNGGNDIYVGGTGPTTVNGGVGNDTYSYISGHGALVVNETGGQDTLLMGSGISSVTLAASGHDLLISHGVAGDTVTLKNQLNTVVGVETLKYAGGTTMSLEGVALTASGSVLYGTVGGDTLTATAGTETLVGNAGDDTLPAWLCAARSAASALWV